jgi:enoyl-[acyl-carrier protein] reductase II
VTLLRTRFCELFDIEAPILQAAIWPATAPELVAAVSNAGGLGSIGAVFGSAEHVRARIERVRQLTDRPFVVNHVVPLLDQQAFEATLEARPAAVSFALGNPRRLVEPVRSIGAKAIHQVHTVAQAREAAELGVDVIIAQGSEAGGQGMAAGVGALALMPEVAEAVAPIPVLAAGGVADGRGLAAALTLGAAGANVGTRFLASEEAAAAEEWKRRIVEIDSEQAVCFEEWRAMLPERERLRRGAPGDPHRVRVRVARPGRRGPRARRATSRGDHGVGGPGTARRAHAVHRAVGRPDPRRPAGGRDRAPISYRLNTAPGWRPRSRPWPSRRGVSCSTA